MEDIFNVNFKYDIDNTNKDYNIYNINDDYYLEPVGKLNYYIGIPNSDNIIYEYPYKCIWTKWNKLDNNIFRYCNYKFNKNDIELVIARHNEDISWLEQYIIKVNQL